MIPRARHLRFQWFVDLRIAAPVLGVLVFLSGCFVVQWVNHPDSPEPFLLLLCWIVVIVGLASIVLFVIHFLLKRCYNPNRDDVEVRKSIGRARGKLVEEATAKFKPSRGSVSLDAIQEYLDTTDGAAYDIQE
jgi:hypothetical protein